MLKRHLDLEGAIKSVSLDMSVPDVGFLRLIRSRKFERWLRGNARHSSPLL